MSFTLLVWLALFILCAAASVAIRPVYAVAGYMLTFFLCPPFWWWGDPIGGYRWSLYSGLILLVATLIASPRQISTLPPNQQRVFKISWLMVLNATFVNYLLSADLESSTEAFFLLAKFMLLLYLLFAAIKNRDDLQITMISILLGAAYVGYEIVFNDRGEIVGNRLEGVGAPGASTANHFACLMVVILPMVAPFFLVGKMWQRLLVIVCAPLILNVVLLCNSRGAFLAAIVSAIVFMISAPSQVRGKVIKVVAAGSLAAFLLMGDARIMERFMTTFASAEDRDNSAQSRFDFAKAGLAMVADHPLGSGGGAFKKVRGLKYLQKLGVANEYKAIHNGYVTEMASWGIQGGLLRIGLLVTVLFAMWKSLRASEPQNREEMFDSLTACSLLAGLSALLISSCFGDHLDSEWGIWVAALMLALMALGSQDKADEIAEGGDVV